MDSEIRAILTLNVDDFERGCKEAATINGRMLKEIASEYERAFRENVRAAEQANDRIINSAIATAQGNIRAARDEANERARIARSIAKDIADDHKEMWSAIGSTAKWGAGLVIAGFWLIYHEAEKVFSAVEESMNRMFRTAKDANAFQATIDQMNGLEYAAQKAGSTLGNVERITGQLEKSIGAALSSGKSGDKARGVFASLGLDPESLAHMGGAGALSAIASEVGKIGSAAERAQILTALTGGRGKQLSETIELFKQLRGGVEAVTDEMAHYYGVANSEEAYAAIEIAKESTIKLSWVWRGMVDTLTTQVAPAIVNVQKMLDAVGVTGKAMGELVTAAFKDVVQYINYVVTDLTFLYDFFGSYWNFIASAGNVAVKAMIAGFSNFAYGTLRIFDGIETNFREMINGILKNINRLITAYDRIALATGAKTVGTFDLISNKSFTGGLADAAGKVAVNDTKAAIDAAKEFYNNAKNFSPGTMASHAINQGKAAVAMLLADIGAKDRAKENAADRAGALDATDKSSEKTHHKELGLAGHLGSRQSIWALTQEHSKLDATQENTKAVKELTHAMKKGSHVGGQRQAALTAS